jgi:hypothetical protein
MHSRTSGLVILHGAIYRCDKGKKRLEVRDAIVFARERRLAA